LPWPSLTALSRAPQHPFQLLLRIVPRQETRRSLHYELHDLVSGEVHRFTSTLALRRFLSSHAGARSELWPPNETAMRRPLRTLRSPLCTPTRRNRHEQLPEHSIVEALARVPDCRAGKFALAQVGGGRCADPTGPGIRRAPAHGEQRQVSIGRLPCRADGNRGQRPAFTQPALQ
jgi:hypothetical protein